MIIPDGLFNVNLIEGGNYTQEEVEAIIRRCAEVCEREGNHLQGRGEDLHAETCYENARRIRATFGLEGNEMSISVPPQGCTCYTTIPCKVHPHGNARFLTMEPSAEHQAAKKDFDHLRLHGVLPTPPPGSAAQSSLKPNYNMIFSNASGQIGTLDFNGPEMKFTGNAEESAKVLFDWVAKSFAQRLAEECRSQAKRIAELENALRFYADIDNYQYVQPSFAGVGYKHSKIHDYDRGEVANKALRAGKEEE